MTTVETGFIIPAIRSALDAETWERSEHDDDTMVRRVWLGTVFGITPSGKIYAPFACSNVMGCETCKGTGTLPLGVKRRVYKRWQKRHAAILARFYQLRDSAGLPAARTFMAKQPKRFRLLYLSAGPSCGACGGSGSREAHLDEVWRETLESELEEIGAFLECEDDSYFAGECRSADDEDEEADAA